MPRSPRVLPLVLAVGLGLAACGSSAADGPVAPIAGVTTTTSTATATTDTATGSAPATATTLGDGPATPGASSTTASTGGAEQPLAGFSARSVEFGPFTVSVTEALVSDEDPDTFRSNAPATVGTDRYAYLAVRLTNRLKLATDFLAYDQVRLAPAQGEPVPASDLLGKLNETVARGATAAGWIAFRLEDGQTLDGATLLLGEVGFEGRALPLTGVVPAPTFPATLAVSTPLDVVINETGWRIDITTATLDTWIGFDHGDGAVVTDHATEGRRKLLVAYRATITRPEDGETADFIPYDAVRLVVNGDRLSDKAEESDGTTIDVGTTGTGFHLFDVPATGNVELEWGDVTGTPVRMRVPLPAA